MPPEAAGGAPSAMGAEPVGGRGPVGTSASYPMRSSLRATAATSGPAMAEYVLGYLLALTLDARAPSTSSAGAPGSRTGCAAAGRAAVVVGLGEVGSEIARC